MKKACLRGIPILDACCGGKMFYFDKHDSRVLFQDKAVEAIIEWMDSKKEEK